MPLKSDFFHYVKDYKGYTGRNPKTGEPFQVLPKKLSFFKCGKELKEPAQRLEEMIL
ncbi:MAG: HU family DNA-binding protein [Desulfobacterales bacterium]|nr:HU family DNA-binding protein [Desulfobacterales bacterium]